MRGRNKSGGSVDPMAIHILENCQGLHMWKENALLSLWKCTQLKALLRVCVFSYNLSQREATWNEKGLPGSANSFPRDCFFPWIVVLQVHRRY